MVKSSLKVVIATVFCMTMWHVKLAHPAWCSICLSLCHSLSFPLSLTICPPFHFSVPRSPLILSSFVSFSLFFMVQFFLKEELNSSPLTIAMLPWKQRDEIETNVFFFFFVTREIQMENDVEKNISVFRWRLYNWQTDLGELL